MRGRFVIHEHHATALHFDLRLEVGGVFKSWAVPKGPSKDPKDKRLAVAVPDHSLSYGDFEGTLSEGSYGAGEVRIWDNGHYETDSDPALQLAKGKLVFSFFGLKLRGEYALVQTAKVKKNWLLIKLDDNFADPSWDLELVRQPQKKSRGKTTLLSKQRGKQ
jgi:bifunctional non-homologous end joining protein LigD